MYVYIYTYTHIYIHTYIHTCIHTYIYVHTRLESTWRRRRATGTWPREHAASSGLSPFPLGASTCHTQKKMFDHH